MIHMALKALNIPSGKRKVINATAFYCIVPGTLVKSQQEQIWEDFLSCMSHLNPLFELMRALIISSFVLN